MQDSGFRVGTHIILGVPMYDIDFRPVGTSIVIGIPMYDIEFTPTREWILELSLKP